MQVLSWRPRAFYFPKFATPEQCQQIINMAKPKLEPSTVMLSIGETEQPLDIRTRYVLLTIYVQLIFL